MQTERLIGRPDWLSRGTLKSEIVLLFGPGHPLQLQNSRYKSRNLDLIEARPSTVHLSYIYVAWNLPAVKTFPLLAPPSAGPMDLTFPVILFDTVLGLSPKSSQILFLDFGFFPCHLASASTLCISAIHFLITSASKRPILCFACVLPPRSPEGGLGFFFLSFGVSGQRGLRAIFKWHGKENE